MHVGPRQHMSTRIDILINVNSELIKSLNAQLNYSNSIVWLLTGFYKSIDSH